MLKTRRSRVVALVVASVVTVLTGLVFLLLPGNTVSHSPVNSSAASSAATSQNKSLTTTAPATKVSPVVTTTVSSKQQPPPAPTSQRVTRTLFFGMWLPMDPSWGVYTKTPSSSFIDAIDLKKGCHSEKDICPSLRIFNYQVSSPDQLIDGYADCDTLPVPAGTRVVGGKTAFYYVMKPCQSRVMPADNEHRIYVIPGKLVLVAVLEEGKALDNLDAVLAAATWE